MYNGYLAILHYNKPVSDDIRWENIFYSISPPCTQITHYIFFQPGAYSHIIHTIKIENHFYLHNDIIRHLSTPRLTQCVQNVANHYTKMYFPSKLVLPLHSTRFDQPIRVIRNTQTLRNKTILPQINSVIIVYTPFL